jgi:type IV secretory pathway VirB2 component (pilin)
MDASHRAALMLVCFIAIALMGFGLIDLSLHWMKSLHWIEGSLHKTPMHISDFVFPTIFFVPGVVILFKANAIAEWISNKLDE